MLVELVKDIDEKDELDLHLIEAINRMNSNAFKALVTKLLSSIGLEMISSEFKDDKANIETRVGEEIHDAAYPRYLIRVERGRERTAPEELQDFVGARKDRDMGMIFITTEEFSEDAKLYAKEFEIDVVDDTALAALVRKFDLLPDVMIYKDKEILKEEKGRFLPSIDELENIFELGDQAYATGAYAEALRRFSRATELKPNYDAAWCMRGIVLNKLEKNEEALKSFTKALEYNIENEDAWYNMGLALYALGRYDEEIECYDKAIELRKDFLDAWNNKGTTLLQLERYEEASECFDEILKLDANFKRAWNNKGIVLKKLKRAEEAIECFTNAIKTDPNYLDAWLNRGIMLLDAKRYKEAYHCFDAALEIDEENVQALYNKAKTLEAVGQYSKAIEYYDSIIVLDPGFRQAKRRKKKALKSLEQKGDQPLDEDFFKIEPGEANKYLITTPKKMTERILVEKRVMEAEEPLISSKEVEKKKHYDEAEKGVKGISLRERELEKVALDLKKVMEDLEVKAKILEDKERSLKKDVKVSAEEEQIKGREDRVDKHLLHKLGEFDELDGEDAVTMDLEASPELGLEGVKTQLMPLIEEGMERGFPDEESDSVKEISVLYNLGRFNEAFELVELAQKLAPNSTLLWNMKGNILRHKKHFEDALQCYSSALKLDQNHVITLVNLMSLSLELGIYDEAQELCEKVLALRPKDEKFILEKALLKARGGQIDEAISTLDSLMEINDKLESVWNLKGILLHSLNQEDEAMLCFERALGIYPDYSIARNNKGVIFYHAGKYEEALGCFNRAFDITSSDQLCHNRAATLEKLERFDEAEKCRQEIREMEGQSKIVDLEKLLRAPKNEDTE